MPPLSPVLRHIRKLVSAGGLDTLSDAQLLESWVRHRDEGAFAELVRRHGPLVLGVCRQVLRHEQDAEDAFQATFLILARHARSIRQTQAVGSWLYRVAYRTASHAGVIMGKRRAHTRESESRQPAMTCCPPPDEAAWRETEAMLHEEVNRLPEKLRAPFVLCALEGKSGAEAARQLNWKEGTVRARLTQARQRLLDRLTRRGIELPAVLCAALLSARTIKASVPVALLTTTVAGASRFAAGAKAGVASTMVIALVEGARKSMMAAKIKMLTALVLGVSVTVSGAGVLASRNLRAPQAHADNQPQAAELKNNRPTTLALADLGEDQRKGETRIDHDEPLPAGAVTRLGTTRFRHGDDIGFLGFGADGKTIVACSGDGTRIWDAATGKVIQRFPKESGISVGFGAILSPDRKWLVTGGPKHPDNETLLHIWEMATAKEAATIDTGKLEGGFSGRRFGGICFSPDGKLLTSRDGMGLNEITLWDFATASKRSGWVAGKEPIASFAFLRDGKTLVTAGRDHTIRFWNVETQKERKQIPVGAWLPQELAVSPDGSLLAVRMVNERVEPSIAAAGAGQVDISLYQENGTISIWDIATGKELRQIVDPREKKGAQPKKGSQLPWGFESLAFLPNSKELLAGSRDGSLYLCDAGGGKAPRRIWRSSTGPWWVMAASPDGKRVAVALEGTIGLIDLRSGKEVFPMAGHPRMVYQTAFTPDGGTAITASADDLYLWDAKSGRLRKRLQGDQWERYINGLQIVDGGRKAVTSAYDEGSLRIWDLIAQKEAGRIHSSSDQRNILLAVSPDGNTIAVGGSGSVVVLCDWRTGKEIQRLTKETDEFNAYGAAFTPDGRTLVVWYSSDNMAYHWDLVTGKKVREYTFLDQEDPAQAPPPAGAGGRPVYFADVSPDGRVIAFGSQNRFLELRDLATGDLLHRLTKLLDGVCPLTFSPDSRMLAWSGWWKDPSVHVIEVATGRERRRFAGHTGRVLSLSFSADGARLISGSADTTALIWDLTGRVAGSEVQDKALTEADLDACWNDLAAEDAAKAYGTVQKLVASPESAVSLLRSRLGPASAVDEKRIARLIADLDSNQFAVREAAEKELEKYGELAYDLCRKALEGKPSLETRTRLGRLMARLSGGLWSQLSPPRVRALRAVEVLERIGTPEARQLLDILAKGAPDARMTQEAKASLERLAKRPAQIP